MEPTKKQFHFDEVKHLREEVVGLIDSNENMMRYVLTASIAVYAWLAVKANNEMYCAYPDFRLAWYLPIALTIFGSLATFLKMKRVGQLGEYLIEAENILGDESLGWEKYLSQKFPILKTIGAVYWTALIAITIIVPQKIAPICN